MVRKLVALGSLALVLAWYLDLPGDSFDPTTVAGQRVLVTGASSGIGEQLAYAYSRLGARLAIVARRSDRLERVAQQCLQLGATVAFPLVADLGSTPVRHQVVREAEHLLGGLDQVVLNHAIMPTALWLGTEQNVTDAVTIMEVNFVSYVDVASRALPALERSRGRLGVVASVVGKLGSPGIAAYCASKFAVVGFFSSLRQEQERRGTGVTVTTVILGPVATDIAQLTPKQKERVDNLWFDFYATPEDAAVAILRGVATGQPEVYYARLASLLVTLHSWFPRWTERLLGQYTFELASSS